VTLEPFLFMSKGAHAMRIERQRCGLDTPYCGATYLMWKLAFVIGASVLLTGAIVNCGGQPVLHDAPPAGPDKEDDRNRLPQPSAPSTCRGNDDCGALAPVCDLATGTCVECTSEHHGQCKGATSTCGADHKCRAPVCAAHAECLTEACSPDGSCVEEAEVAYV